MKYIVIDIFVMYKRKKDECCFFFFVNLNIVGFLWLVCIENVNG